MLAFAAFALSVAEHSQAGESPRERLAKAEAMFQERCKTAGEKIYRTVENVEGVFLLKLRPNEINFDDQFLMDDPFGSDLGGDGYIKKFLLGRNAVGSITDTNIVRNGYRFVEAVNPKDGNRYRYSGSTREVSHISSILMGGDGKTTFLTRDFVLDKYLSPGESPRYGVTYDDISTREDREYWIAGGSLKIVDLETNEVIAERIGYMMDRGQGNTSGGRSPWLLAPAHACPSFPTTPGGRPFKLNQTRDFVEKVLLVK